jgi:ATP-dependent Clp protease ATP-binding subunit ClpB
VDFKNTIVIMTSNLGAEFMLDGIDESGEFKPGVEDQVREVLRRHFRPEFLNRVDETVLFRPLTQDQLVGIIDLLVAGLRKRLEDRNIGLTLTDRAKAFIAQSAYDPSFGARPLHRYLKHNLETPLAKRLIGGDLADGQTVTVDEREGELVFG